MVETLMKQTSKSDRGTAVMGRKSKRTWFALGLGGCLLAIGGIASAAAVSTGGQSKAAGPAVNTQLTACLAAHKAYCPDTSRPQPNAGPQQPAALAAPMSQDEAVASALRGAAPAAKAGPAAATSSRTSLSAYEKAAYGGAHVNQAFDPSTAVWVVQVAAAPNPLDVDTAPGQKPVVYTHYTVVIDVASHHWIEESFQR